MTLTLNSRRCGQAQGFVSVLTYTQFLLWHETQKWEHPLTPVSPRRKRKNVGRWGKEKRFVFCVGSPLAVVPRLTSKLSLSPCLYKFLSSRTTFTRLAAGISTSILKQQRSSEHIPTRQPLGDIYLFYGVTACHGEHVEVREQLMRMFSPSTTWVTGIEFRSSGLYQRPRWVVS